MNRLTIASGDITTFDVDAIVNAANSDLARGGGVCGAIFAAAGPGLEEACDRIGHCPTGSACITPGFALRARHVIHAVAPIWGGGGQREAVQLASAYRSSLALAEEHALTSIAFPLLGTGIYGVPLDRGAAIALRTARDWLAAHDLPRDVVMVAFGGAALDVLQREQAKLDGATDPPPRGA